MSDATIGGTRRGAAIATTPARRRPVQGSGYVLLVEKPAHPGRFVSLDGASGDDAPVLHAGECFDLERDVVTIFDDHARGYLVWKGAYDRVVAVTLLVLLAPLLVAVAVLIKLDSKGPVIFTQRRVGSRATKSGGRRGWRVREFRIVKFRTMQHGANEELHRKAIGEFIAAGGDANGGGLSLKLGTDARVTRVGRILRRYSIDELPQLVNVARGEMSLVGPRPVPAYEVHAYDLPALERLAALPGVTGLAQIRGRSSLSFGEIVSYDAAYVRGRGLLLDLKIILGTVPAMLRAQGAG